jgi:CDGSH-type Zn-finger protein
MQKNTRLSGHTLRAEGKPFVWNSGRYVRSNIVHGREVPEGRALCSCGTASQKLNSDAERKRWHRDVHKRQIREQAASQTEEG